MRGGLRGLRIRLIAGPAGPARGRSLAWEPARWGRRPVLPYFVDHMCRDGVAPDLVTHGCFVDAYLERRLARNLTFAFDRFDGNAEAVVATDGIIFEAFGKGGFHASSEALLEATGEKRRWTYYKLLGVYLRKQHRRNQVF